IRHDIGHLHDALERRLVHVRLRHIEAFQLAKSGTAAPWCRGYRALAASSTSSAWPSTFTFGQTRAMRPSGPIRKVARRTPIYLRPYMDFSAHTPYASSILSVSSDPSAIDRSYLALNLSC